MVTEFNFKWKGEKPMKIIVKYFEEVPLFQRIT